jgi:hypothetical protein
MAASFGIVSENIIFRNSCGLFVSLPTLESAVQRGSRDLEGLTNLGNRVLLIGIECLGNASLPCCQCIGSATFSPSGTGCHQSCGCSLPDNTPLKLRQGAKEGNTPSGQVARPLKYHLPGYSEGLLPSPCALPVRQWRYR